MLHPYTGQKNQVAKICLTFCKSRDNFTVSDISRQTVEISTKLINDKLLTEKKERKDGTYEQNVTGNGYPRGKN